MILTTFTNVIVDLELKHKRIYRVILTSKIYYFSYLKDKSDLLQPVIAESSERGKNTGQEIQQIRQDVTKPV